MIPGIEQYFPDLKLPEGFSLLRVEESKDYECRTYDNKQMKKRWFGKEDGIIRYTSYIKQIASVYKYSGNATLADNSNPYQLIEYYIDLESKTIQEKNICVLVVDPDAPGICTCIKLGDLNNIPFPKKSQLKQSHTESSKRNRKRSSSSHRYSDLRHSIKTQLPQPRPRSYSNQSTLPSPSDLNQSSHQSSSTPVSREFSPLSSRGSFEYLSTESSPPQSRESSPPPPIDRQKGPLSVLEKSPTNVQLTAFRATRIHAKPCPWGPELDGSYHYHDGLQNILDTTDKEGATYLVNRENPLEIVKSRITTREIDGRMQKVWWEKNRYNLVAFLNSPTVYFGSLKISKDPSKPPRGLIPIPTIEAPSDQIDYSRLIIKWSSKTQETPAPVAPPILTDKQGDHDEVSQKTINSLQNLSNLIPLHKTITSELQLFSIRSKFELAKIHPSLKSFPFLDSINGKKNTDEDVKKFIGGMHHRVTNYCFFTVCSSYTTQLRLFLVENKTIYDCGLFALYTQESDEAPFPPIYIAQTDMSQERILREGRAQPLDAWLNEFVNQYNCVPYHELFNQNHEYTHENHKVKISRIMDSKFGAKAIISRKFLGYEYPLFDQVYRSNAENKLNIPLLFLKEIPNKLNESSSYFFFKPHPDEKKRHCLVLEFCKEGQEPDELTYNVVSVMGSNIEICVEYVYDKYKKKKQLIDLNILTKLLIDQGFKPIYPNSISLEPESNQEIDNYNPFLEPIRLLKGDFNPF